MTTVSTLPDKLADTLRRIADLEAKAETLRAKVIALGRSTVAGERFIATVRLATFWELDPVALRKRVSEDQLQRCMVAISHTMVAVHERDGGD